MNNKDKASEILIETLWQEINNAIIMSERIRSIIKQLSGLGAIDSIINTEGLISMKSLINEALKKNQTKASGNNAHEVSSNRSNSRSLRFTKNGSNKLKRQGTNNHSKSLTNQNQRIDGKRLSLNEIKFQELLAESFDEIAWFKKARISL